MKKYATEQRKALHSFFEKHPDRQYSVEEIAEYLCDTENISASSIYRNVNDMVSEGTLGRFPAKGKRKFLYQYIGTDACKDHMHLKCETCGQLFHVDDDAMDDLLAAIGKKNSFQIDVQKTILFGLCEHCEHENMEDDRS